MGSGFEGRNLVSGRLTNPSRHPAAASGDRFALKGRCQAHRSYITHFDFSIDGSILQSNCGAYELLFHNTETCEQIPSATTTRDTEWATWTCTLGWPVRGTSASHRAVSRCVVPGVVL